MLGVYLHIPYCMSKCKYCDFYSAGRKSAVPDAYLRALVREYAMQKAQYACGAPDTLYFGGGTPSLLTAAQVCELIDAVNPREGAEITLEANPETVSAQSLSAYRAAGVNRISFGVQTAFDASLARLARSHSAQVAERALELACQAGFTNISGDIMLALPHYSLQEVDATLRLLAEGGCTHISSYLLKIEPNTAFGKRPPEGLPTEDEAADYYLYAVEALAKLGYAQYEISNFAKPGFESRHNLLYWHGENYLGIGPAAHSCMEGKRFFYPADTAAFIAGDARTIADGEYSKEDAAMLALRLCEGLDVRNYNNCYNCNFLQGQQAFVQKLCSEGFAQYDKNTLRLTPKGMLMQNSILAQLL